MNTYTQTMQLDNDHDDNHFFDDQALSVLSLQELNMVSGGANCSYLGVIDYSTMTCHESRNYSC